MSKIMVSCCEFFTFFFVRNTKVLAVLQRVSRVFFQGFLRITVGFNVLHSFFVYYSRGFFMENQDVFLEFCNTGELFSVLRCFTLFYVVIRLFFFHGKSWYFSALLPSGGDVLLYYNAVLREK